MNWSKNEIKTKEIKDISSTTRTNWEETKINSENRQNNRNIIEKIINKEPELLTKEEIKNVEIITEEIDKPNYKKYFMIGSILILSGIIWYYWNDIRPAAGDAGNTVMEKIRSFRSWFNNDQSNNINNNSGNNSMNIPTNVNSPNPDNQLIDNNQPPKIDNKTLLTSPSLENLKWTSWKFLKWRNFIAI